MGLLRGDPWQKGIRTNATIERVMVTTISSSDNSQIGNEHVHLAFGFTDEHGQPVVWERRFEIGRGGIPAPGSRVQIAYFPGKPKSIDYMELTAQPPDPSVPRGWGAGIFELEDLGTHKAHSLHRSDLDRQRQLFRTGRRAQAEVVSARHGNTRKRGVPEYTIGLRIDGAEREAKAWVPDSCAPQPGDLIEVALSEDGTEIALDTDERYDGPPGQALVFTTPPGVAAQRPAQPAFDPSGVTAWQMPANMEDLMATARQAMGMAGGAVRAHDATARVAQLQMLLDQGTISEAEFASLKAQLLGG